MARQMTPILRPLRTDSGTLYVFPSASEDIGLNLNSRNNRVALAYYALLNLPEAKTSDMTDNDMIEEYKRHPNKNYFNICNIPDAANHLNNANDLTNNDKIAAVLQNYMMNMETTIINQSDYDYSANETVSERVFWKFLKETGAIRWERTKYDIGTGSAIYQEAPEYTTDSMGNTVETGYKRVVQCVGQISAGNSLANEFGMYNETYVNIPSSYGAGRQYFKIVEDNNFQLNRFYVNESGDYLAGRDNTTSVEGYTQNIPYYDTNDIQTNTFISVAQPEGSDAELKSWAGDKSELYSYITLPTPEAGEDLDDEINVWSKSQNADPTVIRKFKRSKLDGVELINNIDELSQIFALNEDTSDSYITYDSINTDSKLIYKENFEFNAILLYYSIYDKNTGNELADNLFGILFLNGADVLRAQDNSGSSLNFTIPGYKKKKSNGAGSNKEFGNGYSFKINIKSMSVFDNTDAVIYDNTTSNSLYTEDFNEVISNLNKSVDLIGKNISLNQIIYKDYQNIKAFNDNLQNNYEDLTKKMNLLLKNKFTDITADNIYSKDIQVDNLDVSGNIKVQGTWDVNHITAESFSGDEGMFSSIITDKLSATDASTNNILTVNLKSAQLNSIEATVSNLVVNDAIYNNVEHTATIKDIDFGKATDIIDKITIKEVPIDTINQSAMEIIIDPGTFNPKYLEEPDNVAHADGIIVDRNEYIKDIKKYIYKGTDDVQAIDYSKFIPIIIKYLQESDSVKNKAIKDLQDEIETLKGQLETLQNKINT
jgi:hypothetical protein